MKRFLHLKSLLGRERPAPRYRYAKGASDPAPIPARATLPPPTVLSLINNKGGVGKTTLAVNLAAALSLRTRVLLIDLDSQGSASLSLQPAPAPEDAASLVSVLCDGRDVHDAVRTTEVPGLDLLSGGIDMIEGMKRLANLPDAPLRLREAIVPLRETYGFIFIDCAPTFTIFSHNALLASDAYVIPLLPHHLAIEGMGNLFRTLKHLQDPAHPFPPLLGIVLSMVDYRDPSTFERVTYLRKHFRDRVMLSEVPFHIEAAEAPEQAQSIFDYAHDPRIAESYWALSKEILHRSLQLAQKTGRVPVPDRAG
ncbi:ParA family protein [Rhodocaloribacter sp.]